MKQTKILFKILVLLNTALILLTLYDYRNNIIVGLMLSSVLIIYKAGLWLLRLRKKVTTEFCINLSIILYTLYAYHLDYKYIILVVVFQGVCVLINHPKVINIFVIVFNMVCILLNRDFNEDCIFVTIFLFLFFFVSILIREYIKSLQCNLSKLRSTVGRDELTGLYNRYFLNTLKDSTIKYSKGTSLAIIDLDNFKLINDTYGHDVGDEVLRFIAERLINSISKLDNAYAIRLGGDEFLIYANNLASKDLYDTCSKLCSSVTSKGYLYKNKKIKLGLSAGIANTIEDNIENYEGLYREADLNLYNAKGSGKGLVVCGLNRR